MSDDPVPAAEKPRDRLVAVKLDDASIGRGSPDQEHERSVAIWDIMELNSFAVPNHDGGPYVLLIGMVEKRLFLEVRNEGEDVIVTHHLSLTPFRKVIKDYELICDSYYEAIRTATPQQIEAIDMGRRGLHDEAARLLAERLDGKLTIDFDTARRLFTLIFALHWKG
ncbi:UPF0262 family protein [Chelatococcus reniformis]|uniref:UPF0262 protein GCM10010994_46910 n=1 Tax=Chelatococcus reniformis TaxID=1494448 RepID=A0A916UR19_9HYPH|nr:UPF0262 family protein [Chelatococcus reniformis]GGC83646.1 UPF0262 protein [Chelatococcus reniformis]